MALAAKRGEIPPRQLRGAARSMYKSMTVAQLEEFASTPQKGLPTKKGKRGGNMAQKSYAHKRGAMTRT